MLDAPFAMDQLSDAMTLQVNNISARFTRDLEERERLKEHIDDALTAVDKQTAECRA